MFNAQMINDTIARLEEQLAICRTQLKAVEDIAKVYPDWSETLNAPEFAFFLKDYSKDHSDIYDTNDAKKVIKAIKKFKSMKLTFVKA